MDNGGIVVGFGLIEIGYGVDRRDSNVVRLGGQLIVYRNKKVVSDVGRIALERRKSLDDEGGKDGNEQRNLCSIQLIYC